MILETVDDLMEMDRRLYQLLVVCRKGTAKNHVCVLDKSGFKAWQQMASHSTQEKVQTDLWRIGV